MKFAEHLSAHITPEWRKQYINYEEMKSMLYAAVEQAPSAELVEPEISTRYFAKFDEQFFSFCDKELAKINTFYSEKLAEATRKYASLKNELTETQEVGFGGKRSSVRKSFLQKKNVPARKIQEIKLAFSEFYLSLILLQNYQNLNFTGFRKILKKHDKLLSVDYGARWRMEYVEGSFFFTNKDIDRLIRETETAVTQELEGGDRQRAMKRLRVPPLGEQQSPWTTFKVGLFSGALIVLLISVILSDAKYCVENYLGVRAFVACLPPWFRFSQCLRRYRDTKEVFPHIANAAKYATSFFVVTFSTLNKIYADDLPSPFENLFFYSWITASLISSCYAYTWDIKLDWGLFDSKAGDNKFLREEIVYSSTWFYYFAIIEDLILRFGWALLISMTEMGFALESSMVTFLAPLEVFRRFIWNFFRLENEHLNNCGKFRAVRDISVAPLDTSDQMLIVRMMDEEDGVTNRRKRKNATKNSVEPRIMAGREQVHNSND
ncbi:P[[i]]-sensitive XPR1 orthologue isoform X3 [Leptinotarsa decemlineata]|uniref:P[[i]]-sensitive XPR1 orthologue isoform X3 n=1 Tax=Leptinotarsa decemlineata TaxID=7539 RepID=UPI003D30D15E